MTATVTSKGQVTVPVEMRRKLGIRPGSRLAFVIKDRNRLEVAVLSGSVSELKGALPRPKRALSLAEIEDAVKGGARRKR